jgi:methylmalonyl-CoA/ethylmalonyl-CoA epimerase
MTDPAAAPLPHLGPVDHIGIAVADLEAAKRLYGDTFGLRLVFEEEIPTERVRVAAYDGGGMKLELLASTDPDGPIGRFLARRGEGLHHVCYRVDDVAAMLTQLRAQGIRTLDESPRPGAGGCLVAFIHPKSAGGVLVELSQPGVGGSVHEQR